MTRPTNSRAGQTPETYLGVGKMVNYGGPDTYDEGTADFTYPPRLADDSFAYRGRWTLDLPGRHRAVRRLAASH